MTEDAWFCVKLIAPCVLLGIALGIGVALWVFS